MTLSCNYWLEKGEAAEVNEEIRFLSGKTRLPEERIIEIMKIGLLSRIVELLETGE